VTRACSKKRRTRAGRRSSSRRSLNRARRRSGIGSRKPPAIQASAGTGLPTAELTELRQLRRENKQLKIEREISSKALGPSSHGRPTRFLRDPTGLRVREGSPGHVSGRDALSRPSRLPEWVLCVAHARAVAAGAGGCGAGTASSDTFTRPPMARTGGRACGKICAKRRAAASVAGACAA
jgi:transposase-like protein